LALVISSLTLPLMGMLFPLTSKLNLNNKNEEISNLFSLIYTHGIYIMAPFILLFLTYPRELIDLLFGPTYVPAYGSLMILSIGYVINVLSSFNFSFMSGLGMILLRTKLLYFSATINLILDLILIPKMGIIGAAIGTTVSAIVMFLTSFFYLKKKLKPQINKGKIGGTILLNLFILGLIYLLKELIQTDIITEVILVGLIGGVIYLLIGYLLKIYDLNKIKTIILKK
jgi:O-antigen/teichoic acid export membrane protein